MSLELDLEEAPLKIHDVMRRVARKFGFELGIPDYFFKINEFKRICVNMEYKGEEHCSIFFLKRDKILDVGAYCYIYGGPVIDGRGKLKWNCFTAYISRGGGCFSFPGNREVQIIRKDRTPDWFPVGDSFLNLSSI